LSVKIRLRRMGAKGKPFYRVVVADSRSPRDGRFIELLGHYEPRTDPPTIKLDEEKTLRWLNQGAQPTDTAGALLKKQGIMQKFLAAKPEKIKAPAKAAKPAPLEVEAVEAAPVETAPEPEKKKPAPKKRTTTATSTRKKAEKPKAEEPAPAVESEAAVEEQPTEEQG
jgi:small subunit ribosomal protein S16